MAEFPFPLMVNGGDLGRASAFLKRHDLNTPTLTSRLLVDLPDRDFRRLLERRRANSTAAEAAKNGMEKNLADFRRDGAEVNLGTLDVCGGSEEILTTADTVNTADGG